LVSPLEAPVSLLAGLPPIFIQMGSGELLLADARRFAAKLETAGGNRCTLDVWDSMMHMFQMADTDLAEAHCAIERVGKYIKERHEWNW
jgi:acetyl esterase/lipase